MPDLKPSLELGASLNWTLLGTRDTRMKLDARFPVRLAATVETHPEFIGGQFFPHLNLDVHDPAGFSGWNLGLVAGPVITDRKYNRYFYEVDSQFATAALRGYALRSSSSGVGFWKNAIQGFIISSVI